MTGNGGESGYTWLVTEDVSGVLTLYVFDGDSDRVLFARAHYERTPGSLRRAVTVLRRGEDLAALGPGDPDGQQRWDALGPAGIDAGGFWVIADEEDIALAECMGPVARAELFSPEPGEVP